MPRIMLAQVSRRAGRATALLLGVLIATTGFIVLNGSTATSRLQAVEIREDGRERPDTTMNRISGVRL